MAVAKTFGNSPAFAYVGDGTAALRVAAVAAPRYVNKEFLPAFTNVMFGGMNGNYRPSGNPIQTGGNTVPDATVMKLNNYLRNNGEKTYHTGELGKALEELKRGNGVGSNIHGKIYENGDCFTEERGTVGNIFEYL